MTQLRRIAALAANARLAAISFNRAWAEGGGLIAYGPDTHHNYRRAAYFVDRILRGRQAGRLAGRATHQIQLIINLKAAKSLSIEVPPSLLARADEVIE